MNAVTRESVLRLLVHSRNSRGDLRSTIRCLIRQHIAALRAAK